MRLKSILLTLFLISVCVLNAQKKEDPVLMTINGTPVTLSEFEYSYHKNNTENNLDKKSLEDYVKLYTNFKLKVEEAKAQGLDTTQAFVNEYNGYRSQLAAPYLQDSVALQQIAQNVYQRMQEVVEVSHILLLLPEHTFPKDTIEVWNKLMNIRKDITEGKADFAAMALEHSQDPAAKQTAPAGYMGWTTPMMFVEEFEDAMYATPVNTVSIPVRTQFGYHLIKVHNRRPNPGDVKVAHIMFGFRPDMSDAQKDSLKAEAEKVYQKVQAGENFAELAKTYSSDNHTKVKGGEMDWFGVARMPKEFENASFALKNIGDVSKPIATQFGYHIIKLLKKRPVADWETAKDAIINNLNRGMRREEVTALRLKGLKEEQHVQSMSANYSILAQKAQTVFTTDSAFIEAFRTSKDPLFKINGKTFSVGDFASYLETHTQPMNPLSTDDLSEKYNQYFLETCMKEKDASLAEQYDEFRFLSQEYYDGILLFEVMNNEVWNKAQQDNTGLATFFENNHTKYKWDTPKYVGNIILCKNEYSKQKVSDLLKDNPENVIEAIHQLQEKDKKVHTKIESGAWTKGENDFIDYTAFDGDIAPATANNYPLYIVHGQLKKNPDLNDIRGEVIADYQNYLENQLLDRLHKKFKVTLNKEAFKKLR